MYNYHVQISLAFCKKNSSQSSYNPLLIIYFKREPFREPMVLRKFIILGAFWPSLEIGVSCLGLFCWDFTKFGFFLGVFFSLKMNVFVFEFITKILNCFFLIGVFSQFSEICIFYWCFFKVFFSGVSLGVFKIFLFQK